MLAQRIRHAGRIGRKAHLPQRRLDHRGEKQPVIRPRRDDPGADQQIGRHLPQLRRHAADEPPRGAHQRVREKRGVNQQLQIRFRLVRRRPEVIGGSRIDRRGDRLKRQLRIPAAQGAFSRAVRPEFKPRRNAAEQPPERLHMGAVGTGRRGLDRHRLFQNPLPKRLQNRVGHAPQLPDPLLPPIVRHCQRPLFSLVTGTQCTKKPETVTVPGHKTIFHLFKSARPSPLQS